MSDTSSPATLDTAAPEVRRERFENAWRSWRPDQEPPHWQQFLPALDEPCSPDVISLLLHIDIEFRVKAGLPALLAEHYFEHPRLQQEDARLDAERQMELIRWEYQQRWQNGRQVRRAEYEAAFPQHADTVRELTPRLRCPRCHKVVVLEETLQTISCPHCRDDAPLVGQVPPFVPESPNAAETSLQFDSRAYQLVEQLGKGGMGEVYRACDPALGRDLAIKVMKVAYHGNAEAERRFLREARITGSLQHPGIVPVHNLGRLADGGLHYTMRLVRGQTFAAILKDEAGKPERLPYLLTIFEKMCQAVAYAHSKRVIHRDLKPANVMVGRFGEVQLMDWGLAKLLTPVDAPNESEEMTEAAGTCIPAESADTPVDLSRTGLGFGTPAYMPPEQALGEWNWVDERVDVFALGAILCEILTGQPAYTGRDGEEVFRRARRGDVAETLERLERCDADMALPALCRECLAPEREGRPRNAGVVARCVADYHAEVQERLRQAELERVAAETRAKEEQARNAVEQERTREALARVAAERRARQRLLGLAAAVLVLLAGGVAGAWWMQQVRAAAQARHEQADREALAALERARERLEKGWRTNDLAKLAEAVAEAERAAAIVRNGGASEAVRQQVSGFQMEAQERFARAEKNDELGRALTDIAIPHETKTYAATGPDQMVMVLAEPSVEEQYAAAFRRRWADVDVDKQEASVVAARLQEEPEAVLQEVIAGLDGWMLERRRQQPTGKEWRRLLGVVERLDHSEPRRQLRALLIGAAPPRAESVAGLLTGRPPWPALWELARGHDWRRLRELRGRMNAADESVLTVLLLGQASITIGDMAGAEEVLRQALARRPDEVALLNALGKVLEHQGPSRLEEAIGCYRAARAKRPGLGVSLGRAFGQAGQWMEGEAVMRDLIRQQPKNPEILLGLGVILCDNKRDYEGAITCFHQAITLKQDLAAAYHNLGVAWNLQGKHGEAETAFVKAISLAPKFAPSYINLGQILWKKGCPDEALAAFYKASELEPNLDIKSATKFAILHTSLGFILQDKGLLDEAIKEHRRVIELEPNNAAIHNNLSFALRAKGHLDEAIACCHKAIELDPKYALAHFTLGDLLYAKGRLEEAVKEYRTAVNLDPKIAALAGIHLNLGVALYDKHDLEGALACYRKAVTLDPKNAKAHNNLGNVLQDKGDLEGAIAYYHKAIEFDPKYAIPHYNLGNIQSKKGDLDGAITHYRKAIELDPKYAPAHYNLGTILLNKGDLDGTVTCYSKAIKLKPDYAEAHCNLGGVLQRQGRFAESTAAYRRGHELGLKISGWRYPSAQWLRAAEHLVELEKKLPAILQGEASPANAGDAVILAWMCQQPFKKRYAASARLYAEAFATESKLFPVLQQQHRYNAVCSATLAAAGLGEDSRLIPDKVVVMFHRWALGWLRDDLTAYAKLAEQNNPMANKAIQQRLTHWQRNPDLASVRDPQALDRLAETEGAAWQSLWRDVDDLAKQVAKKNEPTKGRKEPETPKTKPEGRSLPPSGAMGR